MVGVARAQQHNKHGAGHGALSEIACCTATTKSPDPLRIDPRGSHYKISRPSSHRLHSLFWKPTKSPDLLLIRSLERQPPPNPAQFASTSFVLLDSSLHKISGPLRTGLILLEGSHKISGRARTGLIRSLGRQPPPLPTHLAPTAGSRHKISQPNSHRPHSLSWKGATNPICIDHSLSWKATTTRTSRLNSHRPHSLSFGGSHHKISRPCSHPPARLERSHHKSQPVDRVFNSTTETSKKHMLASLRA